MWGVEKTLKIQAQRFLKQKNVDWLCNQNVFNVNLKSEDWRVKRQQAKELLSNLGIKTPLNKIKVLNVLF